MAYSSSPKVLCVGEVLWDLLPSGAKVGGAPLNVALHLIKLGVEPFFAGRVGNDKLGNEIRSFIIENGLSASLLQQDTINPTSTVIVELGRDNQVSFEIVDNVAWDYLEITEDLKKVADQSDVIIYGTLASRHAKTRDNILSLLANSSLKLIDVNLRPPFNNPGVVDTLLKKANIVKLNNDELKEICSWFGRSSNEKDLTQWFQEKFRSQLVCVTRGANGALVFDGIRFYEHPGFRVNVVDTVGSGDAFLAGFIAKYLKGESIDNALEFACATGSFVATREGATPKYFIEEITALILKERK